MMKYFLFLMPYLLHPFSEGFSQYESLLTFQRIVEDKDEVEYHEYSTEKCKTCPHLEKSTSQNKRKILIINEPTSINSTKAKEDKKSKIKDHHKSWRHYYLLFQLKFQFGVDLTPNQIDSKHFNCFLLE